MSSKNYKLVMFDMDGTLLRDRGIFVIAEKYGFLQDLNRLIKKKDLQYYERSIEIAKLSKNFKYQDFIKIFRDLKLQNDVEKIISILNEKDIKTAIATDSYQFLADDLKNRLGIDYAFANNLIIDKDIITGKLIIQNTSLIKDFDKTRVYSINKGCVLEELCKELNISLSETIAVGDGFVDISMIKKAGLGIAFKAPIGVQKHADIITDELDVILDYI